LATQILTFQPSCTKFYEIIRR